MNQTTAESRTLC